jgi:hypothetical protein
VEGDRHQRRPPPRAVLARVEAVGAQGVRHHWHENCAVAVAVATRTLAVSRFECGR